MNKKKTYLSVLFLLLGISLGSCGGGGGGGVGDIWYSISGKVTTDGSGLTAVTIALAGTATSTTATDASGNYQFSNLRSGSYTITPSKTGYVFAPSNRSVTVSNANITGQDFAATSVAWAKTYGGVNDDVVHSIQQTSDGGFIVAGETYSFGSVNADVWVLKVDVNGNIQWQKTYGGSGYDIAHSIQQSSDNGYIIAWETSSFGGNTNIWVLKLDANGAIQWQYMYGGSGVDKAYCVTRTSDGGYIVTGETNSFGAGGVDIWVLKLDGNGSVVWQKTYGGTKDDLAHSIQQTSDGGYIVAGETRSFGAGGIDLWVLKLDGNGSVVWQKTYGGTKGDLAHSIQQTSDGGYIVAGSTIPSSTIFDDIWVLKLDANGGVVWEKTYGGPNDDVAYSVQQASDGGYIVAGMTASFGNILGEMWVLKLKANGDVDWEKTYGGNDSNSGNFVLQSSDGGYILAGETSSFGAGNADVGLLKLDRNGNIGSACLVIGSSSANVTSKGIAAVNSSGRSTTTSAVVTSTPGAPLDSGATMNTQCSFP